MTEIADPLDRAQAARWHDARQVREVVARMIELLTDGERFLPCDRDAFAIDFAGQRCSPASSLAVAWSWHGALARATAEPRLRDLATAAILTADPHMREARGQRPMTHPETLAALRLVLAEAG